MTGRATLPQREPIEPDAWPTESEREYARAQAALAAHYDLDTVAKVVETDVMGRVHYLATGDPGDDTVVLLHGVATTAAMWLPLVPALADDYRVLVPDRPGQGLSEPVAYGQRPLREELVDYLPAVFEALDCDLPHVVGNSLGGLQAFLLAIDHDRVDRLALVGAPAGLSKSLPLSMRLMTVRGVNRLLFWLQQRGDPVVVARDQTERMLVEDASAVPGVFYEVFGALRGLEDRWRSLRTLVEHQASFGRLRPVFDISTEVVGIERPTRYLWGTEDWFWEPAVGRSVVGRTPDADFEVLEDHGHMPWLEPSDAVANGLREFLPA